VHAGRKPAGAEPPLHALDDADVLLVRPVEGLHADLAHAFFNFVLRPNVAAQEARYTRYATGNHSAWALLDEDMRNDLSTYPPQELLAKLESGMPIDADGQKRRDELWMEVRGV